MWEYYKFIILEAYINGGDMHIIGIISITCVFKTQCALSRALVETRKTSCKQAYSGEQT